MAGVVTFNYAVWVARYPEFAGVTQALAQAYFDEATIYVRNDGRSPISTTALASTFLNMMTAHIAWLNSTRDAQGNIVSAGSVPAPALVGRIASASEGSVSVSTENLYPPGTAQWFQQSVYGSAFWAATAAYRTMHYIARPTIVVDGPYSFRPGILSWGIPMPTNDGWSPV